MGVYLEPWNNIPQKFQTDNITLGIPFLLHLVLVVYLAKYRWKVESRENQMNPGQNKPKSLGSLLGNGIFLVFIFATSLLTAKLNS